MKVSMLLLLLDMEDEEVRATSHMTLRACDHYASSTLIGGKVELGPTLLHTYA